MKILTAIAFAGFMLATMTSEASAWYCRATGGGGSGWGRSDSRYRATQLALFQCSKRGGPYCRIRTCVP